MLIDTTYFFGQFSIPQIEQASVAADVTQYIAEYEPEYLKKMFGWEMAEVAAAFTVAPYAIFLTGASWTYAGGFKRKLESIKQAIAMYVYFYYMRANPGVTVSTGRGEGKLGQGESSINTNTYTKCIRAWNKMVDINVGVRAYAWYNNTVYTTFRPDVSMFKKLNLFF